MNSYHQHLDYSLYLFINNKTKQRNAYEKGGRISTKTRSSYEAMGKASYYADVQQIILRKKSTQLLDSAYDFLDQMRLINKSQDFVLTKDSWTITNKKSGNTIRLKGLYNPGNREVNLTGLHFKIGQKVVLCFEEAHQFTQKDESDVLMAARGCEVFKFYTMNPWNKNHWLVKRMLNMMKEDAKILSTTGSQFCYAYDEKNQYSSVHYSNWRCNNWKDDLKDSIQEIESYKSWNYERWKVASLGLAGIEGDLVFENEIPQMKVFNGGKFHYYRCCIDYAQKRDAFVVSLYGWTPFDKAEKLAELYWFCDKDYYCLNGRNVSKSPSQMRNDTKAQVDMTLKVINDWLISYSIHHDQLEATLIDNSATAFISSLQTESVERGLNLDFEPCAKFIEGHGVLGSIDYLKLMVNNGLYAVNEMKCPNTIDEYENLMWRYNNDNEINRTRPFIGNDHGIDCDRYFIISVWEDFKDE